MTHSTDATVLLVEDEPAVLDSFEMMLGSEYDVRKAGDGEQALTQVGEDVDVVLLDRMMPGMSGDEVLERIRERDLDCPVVMVTAVDPDFDIIEMGFDDYVTKPPTDEGLRATVEDVLERSEYSDRIQDYWSLLAKRSALQTTKEPDELAQSDQFAELEERIAAVRRDLDESNDRLLDDSEFLGALQSIGGEGSEEPDE